MEFCGVWWPRWITSIARPNFNLSPNHPECLKTHSNLKLRLYLLFHCSYLHTLSQYNSLLISPVARPRLLETRVFHTSAWGELHQNGGRPGKAWAHPAAYQRHKGTCFWGLRLAHLGGQTSVPGWEKGLWALSNLTALSFCVTYRP